MNENELIDFINKINDSLKCLSDREVNKLVKEIIRKTSCRPLPPAFKNDTRAINFFKNIINDISQKNNQSMMYLREITDKITNHLNGLLEKNPSELQVQDLEKEFKTFKSKLFLLKDAVKSNFNDNYSRMIDFVREHSQHLADSDDLKCQLSNLIRYISRELWNQLSCQSDVLPNSEDLEVERANELHSLSLCIFSEQYKNNFNNTSGPIDIIHFYESGPSSRSDNRIFAMPRASEYGCGYDSNDDNDKNLSLKINTSHGIGSGVYGRGCLTAHEIYEQIVVRKSYYKIVTIENPLRLKSDKIALLKDASDVDDDCDVDEKVSESYIYSNISVKLQEIVDKAKKIQESRQGNLPLTRTQALEKVEMLSTDIQNIAHYLSQFSALRGTSQPLQAIIKNALLNHLNDARNESDAKNARIKMPINYVIESLGYDGVVSTDNDSFNRGLIAFKFGSEFERSPSRNRRTSPSSSCNNQSFSFDKDTKDTLDHSGKLEQDRSVSPF